MPDDPSTPTSLLARFTAPLRARHPTPLPSSSTRRTPPSTPPPPGVRFITPEILAEEREAALAVLPDAYFEENAPDPLDDELSLLPLAATQQQLDDVAEQRTTALDAVTERLSSRVMRRYDEFDSGVKEAVGICEKLEDARVAARTAREHLAVAAAEVRRGIRVWRLNKKKRAMAETLDAMLRLRRALQLSRNLHEALHDGDFCKALYLQQACVEAANALEVGLEAAAGLIRELESAGEVALTQMRGTLSASTSSFRSDEYARVLEAYSLLSESFVEFQSSDSDGEEQGQGGGLRGGSQVDDEATTVAMKRKDKHRDGVQAEDSRVDFNANANANGSASTTHDEATATIKSSSSSFVGAIAASQDVVAAFAAAPANSAYKLVRGMLLARPGKEHAAAAARGLQPLVSLLPVDLYRTCLAKVLMLMWDIMAAHHAALTWHEERRSAQECGHAMLSLGENATGDGSSVAPAAQAVESANGAGSVEEVVEENEAAVDGVQHAARNDRGNDEGVVDWKHGAAADTTASKNEGNTLQVHRRQCVLDAAETALVECRRLLWDEISRAVGILLDSPAAVEGEHFLHVVSWTEKLAVVGEAFTGVEAVALRASLRRQAGAFFRAYHESNLEALDSMLRKETWKKLPAEIPRLLLDVLDVESAVGDGRGGDADVEVDRIRSRGNGAGDSLSMLDKTNGRLGFDEVVRRGNPWKRQPSGSPRKPHPIASKSSSSSTSSTHFMAAAVTPCLGFGGPSLADVDGSIEGKLDVDHQGHSRSSTNDPQRVNHNDDANEYDADVVGDVGEEREKDGDFERRGERGPICSSGRQNTTTEPYGTSVPGDVHARENAAAAVEMGTLGIDEDEDANASSGSDSTTHQSAKLPHHLAGGGEDPCSSSADALPSRAAGGLVSAPVAAFKHPLQHDAYSDPGTGDTKKKLVDGEDVGHDDVASLPTVATNSSSRVGKCLKDYVSLIRALPGTEPAILKGMTELHDLYLVHAFAAFEDAIEVFASRWHAAATSASPSSNGGGTAPPRHQSPGYPLASASALPLPSSGPSFSNVAAAGGISAGLDLPPDLRFALQRAANSLGKYKSLQHSSGGSKTSKVARMLSGTMMLTGTTSASAMPGSHHRITTTSGNSSSSNNSTSAVPFGVGTANNLAATTSTDAAVAAVQSMAEHRALLALNNSGNLFALMERFVAADSLLVLAHRLAEFAETHLGCHVSDATSSSSSTQANPSASPSAKGLALQQQQQQHQQQQPQSYHLIQDQQRAQHQKLLSLHRDHFLEAPEIARSLRTVLVRRCIARLLPIAWVTEAIPAISYTPADPPAQPAAWTTRLGRALDLLGAQIDGESASLPRDGPVEAWKAAGATLATAIVEGLAKVKACTLEGRAAMSLDLQAIAHAVTRAAPADAREGALTALRFADDYVKAFYVPLYQLPEWYVAHPGYSVSQVLALAACMAESSGMSKRDVAAAVAQVEVGLEKERHRQSAMGNLGR